MECPKCGFVNADSAVKCDCGYIFNPEESSDVEVSDKNDISIQRYVLNVIVRLLFFFGVSPILLLYYHNLSSLRYFRLFDIKVNEFLLLPYGLIIFLLSGIVGSFLDIVLPKSYLIGGKIVVWGFNFSTLTWFEGMEFNVSINAGFRGKGVSIKEGRE